MKKSGNSAGGRGVGYERLREASLGWGTDRLTQALRKRVARRDGSTVVAVPTSLRGWVQGFSPSDAMNEVEWASVNWRPEDSGKGRKPRRAGIATFARQLMALERRRMRRRTPASSAGRKGRKAPGLQEKES